MANCPKCNSHLKLSDWKQHCPHCGANIVVYGLQERLMQDADKAEVQYYHFQKKIDRLKASFIGSKLAIVRIFTSLIPVGALFLPIVKANFGAPFDPLSGNISALTIYDNFDKLGKILDCLNVGGTANYLFAASLVLLVLSLLAMLLKFVFNTLACSPKGKVRNFTMDAIIAVTTLGSAFCFAFMGTTGSVTGSLSYGAYLYILLQAVNIIIDVLCFKQGIEVKHKQCYVGGIPIEEYFEMQKRGMTEEEIRAEQYARLQALQDEKEKELKEKEQKEAESVAG